MLALLKAAEKYWQLKQAHLLAWLAWLTLVGIPKLTFT
jgi:hypothetical protein